jgi:hypothetical protein
MNRFLSAFVELFEIGGCKLGLLMNFDSRLFKDGIKRLIL